MLRLAHRQLQTRCSIIPRKSCLNLRQSTVALEIRRAYAPYPKEGVFQPNSPRRGNNFPSQTPRYQDQQGRAQYPVHQQHQYDSEIEQATLLDDQPPRSDTRRALKAPSAIWYAYVVCFMLGLFGATRLLELLILPLEPGSEEDAELLGMLNAQFEELRIVKEIRNAWTLNDNGEKKLAFSEWDIDHQISSSEPFLRDALAGSAGLAARRMFVSNIGVDCYFFINFGDGTNDSPGIVHTGAVSTVCQYAAEKLVNHFFGGKFETKFMENVFEPLSPGQWCVIMFELDLNSCTEDQVHIAGALCCCSDIEPALDDSTADCHKHALFHAVLDRIEPRGSSDPLISFGPISAIATTQ